MLNYYVMSCLSEHARGGVRSCHCASLVTIIEVSHGGHVGYTHSEQKERDSKNQMRDKEPLIYAHIAKILLPLTKAFVYSVRPKI